MILSSLSCRDWMNLAGSAFEITGAIMMANSYLGAAKRRHWWRILVSALFRGDYARGAVTARDINGDDGVLALQGLAFITMGFALQAAAILFLK